MIAPSITNEKSEYSKIELSTWQREIVSYREIYLFFI